MYTKAPDDVLDYVIDYSTWLGDDEIATSAWSAPNGITIDSDENDAQMSTVWVSGGSLGHEYRLENLITTTGGRTKVTCLAIKIVSC